MKILKPSHYNHSAKAICTEVKSSRAVYLGVQVRALLHEGAYREPETVGQWKLVLDQVVLLVAGVGVVPFVGREARHYEHGDGHEDVRCQHV